MPVHQDPKKNRLKISNIRLMLSILPFYEKKMLKLNGDPEYFGIVTKPLNAI